MFLICALILASSNVWCQMTTCLISCLIYTSWRRGRFLIHISSRKGKFDIGTFICSFVLSKLGHHIVVVPGKVGLWITWSSFYETNLHKIEKCFLQTPLRRPWIENNTDITSGQQENGRAVISTPSFELFVNHVMTYKQ